MFTFAEFYQLLAQHETLRPWLNTLPKQLSDWEEQAHGDMGRWMRALKKFPTDKPDIIDLKNDVFCMIGILRPYLAKNIELAHFITFKR